jgi:group I intron endonuclease
MNIYTIYKAVNKINGKVYIGFDSLWPRRKWHHKAKSQKNNQKFYCAIRKYGWDNFEWSIVYQSKENFHCLRVMEPFFIKEYNSFGELGYNMTLGGEGALGCKHTDEVRKKNSERNSGKNHVNYGKHLSEETKKKISQKNSGVKNGMYGKSLGKILIDGQIFYSNKVAANHYKVHTSTISCWVRKGLAQKIQ